MALENSENMVMPVSPMYGNGMNNAFGGDWAWIILLLLLGWGNNGNGFGANSGTGNLYPWLNQSENTSNGFQNLSTQIANGFANAESAEASRQMATMQQMFAQQTATNQGFNNIQSQLANCCCENRLASANLQSVIQAENCADRAAVSDGIRDILVNQNSNTQRILDQMCNDKIDAKNEKIADLERQLTMANLAASQTAQTAQLLADNNRQTTALEQYLNPVPIPAYIVQNPNCCGNMSACGCA